MEMAVIIQNVLQYYSLRPFLKLIEEKKYWKNDIYIFDPQDTKTGFSKIMEELKQTVIKDGFQIANKNNKKKVYKVCLSPYQNMVDIKYKYLVGYYYGSACSKPFTFNPIFKSKFHGFLLHSNYDASILSIYGKTYIVPRLSLHEIKPRKHPGKKRLLYLPTYGKESEIESVAKILPTIKNNYTIIIKSHHGTAHLKNETNRKTNLEKIADCYYDPTKSTQELFEEADVVLSDNSGAIFDSLYVKKPVCILSNNIDNSYVGIHPLQKKLVDEDIIPYSNKANDKELLRILQEALSTKIIEKQKKESDILFPNKTNGAREWIKILKNYMDDNIDTDYIKIHDHLIMEHDHLIAEYNIITKELNNTKQEKEKLSKTINDLSLQLNHYKNGKLYKLAQKIYEVKNGKEF
ncbi:CDP-glycerol glycerophosphotransferase family protein [Candidatus Saccharibacteria bacterium]|nr:CDP-glycerol glycerophosphotransferase family protein [Candidatus Saccharibacteria bacterium]